MRKFSKLSKSVARISYLLGSVSLILGIMLSFVHVPVSASTGVTGDLGLSSINQPNACEFAFKCEQSSGCNPDPASSYTADPGKVICLIIIKEATNEYTFTSNGCVDVSPPGGDGSDDYCAYGIGTNEGSTMRLCEENGQTGCHQVSHTEYYVEAKAPPSTPTQTNTPTPTETNTPTPTDTNTPTPTDTNTPTPTETSEVTSTPTSTKFVPSETPTNTSTSTPIADTLTPTATQTKPPSGSDTPTPTSTSVLPSVTPTSTILATAVTPTSTDPAATETLQPTLPPPQVTGTQPSYLIPVTGVDLSSPLLPLEKMQQSLINLGLALLGIGLIFQGIGKKIELY